MSHSIPHAAGWTPANCSCSGLPPAGQKEELSSGKGPERKGAEASGQALKRKRGRPPGKGLPRKLGRPPGKGLPRKLGRPSKKNLAPSPVLPTDAPTQTLDSDPMSVDQPMSTMPQSRSKVSRPREDDKKQGPAAKRSKVDGPSPVAAGSTDPKFKIPAQKPGHTNTTDYLTITTTQNLPETAKKPITAAQKKHLQKVLSNVKRSANATCFAEPVDPVKLSIPTYPDVIKEPMDLKTLGDKLKNDAYPSLQGFKYDVDLILSNAIKFNGPDHVVVKAGRTVAKSLEKGMAKLPGPEV
ncbi:MAG: hypothetical protein LQ350_003952 [Teloschistes chrysophthalmus]|nr:MAG: hypothetical protein LQ350_003952 [Niorma chrysophthalma]